MFKTILNKKKLFSLFLIIFSFQFLGCTPNKKIESKQTLNLALSTEIPNLDPQIAYDEVSWDVIRQVYEPLYQFHYLKRPYEIEPLLADGLPLWSNDLKQVTIKIKKNIFYQTNPLLGESKRTVRANDFITAIKRIAFAPTASPGFWLFEGKILGIDDWKKKVGNDLALMLKTPVDGLEATDDQTLIIKLTTPYPQLIYALTLPFTVPMPEEIVAKTNNQIGNIMLGTGPFKVTHFVPGMGLTLLKNELYREDYYPETGQESDISKGNLKDAKKKIPFLDEIHFTVIKESQTRWLKILAKELDLGGVPKDQFKAAFNEKLEISNELKAKNLDSTFVPTLTLWWLSFNMKNPLLGKNLKLRQAIAHAIDFDQYRLLFTNNLALPMDSLIPSTLPSYLKKDLPFSYNIEKAKTLLKESGFENGKGLPEITFAIRNADSVARQQAEFYQLQLAKIGIKIKPITLPFAQFLKDLNKGNFQIFVDGWAFDYPDATNILQMLYSKNISPGANHSNYSNKEFDQLFNELEKEIDPTKQQKILSNIQDIIWNELPWIPIMWSRGMTVFDKKIKNFKPDPLTANNLKYIRID